MIGKLQIAAVFSQNRAFFRFGDFPGAIQINIIIRFLIKNLARSGAAEGNGFHLGQIGKIPKQAFDHVCLLPSIASAFCCQLLLNILVRPVAPGFCNFSILNPEIFQRLKADAAAACREAGIGTDVNHGISNSCGNHFTIAKNIQERNLLNIKGIRNNFQDSNGVCIAPCRCRAVVIVIRRKKIHNGLVVLCTIALCKKLFHNFCVFHKTHPYCQIQTALWLPVSLFISIAQAIVFFNRQRKRCGHSGSVAGSFDDGGKKTEGKAS